MITSATKYDVHNFIIEDKIVQSVTECNYLGILVDRKLSFLSHIDHVVKRLSNQCGNVSKLRYCVLQKQLLNYYRTNINSII